MYGQHNSKMPPRSLSFGVHFCIIPSVEGDRLWDMWLLLLSFAQLTVRKGGRLSSVDLSIGEDKLSESSSWKRFKSLLMNLMLRKFSIAGFEEGGDHVTWTWGQECDLPAGTHQGTEFCPQLESVCRRTLSFRWKHSQLRTQPLYTWIYDLQNCEIINWYSLQPLRL